VVDLVNTGFKRSTPGLHHGLKRLLATRRGQH
jgi:hypothetical protein